MKKVAMIPIALGSKRIKDKNLLLVNGNLMVTYVIEACKKANLFDEIYLNSEHRLFEKIAVQQGVKFYERSPFRGGSTCRMKNISAVCENERCQVHDHFVYDFLTNIECDYLFMVHATSPLLKAATIRNFVEEMLKGGQDSFFSCVEDRKESFLNGEPINFDGKSKVPTQDLEAVQSIAWGITGWKCERFLADYASGPTFCGNVGFMPIDHMEGLDVDTWEDLRVVEACLAYKNEGNKHFYYDERITKIESDLQGLIDRDGVPGFDASGANKNWNRLKDVKAKMGSPPWCYVVAYSDSDQCCFICQPPGDGCRTHCHVTKDEWWYIVEGEFEWFLPFENETIKGKAGDTVFLPKGTVHKIKCIGDGPGIRLAHGARDMEHIYYE